MPTFTSPIKPLIMAMALGFSQYGLAEVPSSCDSTIIIDSTTENDSDTLTTFDEAWTYIESCPNEQDYTLQFNTSFYGLTLSLPPQPYALNNSKNVTLSLELPEDQSTPASLTLESSDLSQNIFLIDEGSNITTEDVIRPTEVVLCGTAFEVDTLINNEYDGYTSFDEAWSSINENCNSASGSDSDLSITSFSISFAAAFNGQTVVLNSAPYKINNDINITVSTDNLVTLSTTNSDQVIFAQSNSTVLDSNYENKAEDDDLILTGDSNSNIILTNVALTAESLQCASAFTIDTVTDDIYDFEYSFDEIWSVVSTTCPGSTEYTINFNSSFNSQSLELTSSPYSVNDARIINISASTASPLTLESSESSSSINFFTVSGGSQLSLSGLIFNGNQIANRSASAISSSGSDSKLSLSSVTMNGFYATGDVNGAAISSTSPTIISNSVFDDNQATVQGGAIRISSADLTLSSTTFTNNVTTLTTNDNTDTSGNSDAGGAAVAFVNHLNDEGNTLTITDGTFTNNQALGFGGAILLRGAKAASISDTTFSGNTVDSFTANGISQAYGGAIALDRQTNITIDKSVFDGNTAQRSGGAIHVGNINADGSLIITSSNLINNVATENGAALNLDTTQSFTTNISQTSINTNSATGNGGAIYVHEKLLNLAIANTTISANTANKGAGIFFEDAVIEGSSINHSTIVNNMSISGAGGIQATNSPAVTLSHDIISGNNTNTSRQACVPNTQAGFDVTFSLINEEAATDDCAAYMADGNSTVSATDPLLIPLNNNGGVGETHYLEDTSPAIDMGDATLETPPSIDQRGSARISRGIIDLGAVEYGNLATNDAQEIPNAILSPENEYSQVISSYFTQPQGDTLRYTITNLPAGLTFNDITSTISGTPEYNDEDDNGEEDFYSTIKIIAISNNTDLEVSQSSFTMTVGYSAPVYEGLTSLAVNTNSGLVWDLAKSTDVDNQAITYTLSGLPEGLSFDENNVVVGRTTLAMVENSPYTLELQSIDEFDTTTSQITLKVIDPDDVVIITDTESGAASLNVWLLSGLTLIGLGGFRRRQPRL